MGPTAPVIADAVCNVIEATSAGPADAASKHTAAPCSAAADPLVSPAVFESLDVAVTAPQDASQVCLGVYGFVRVCTHVLVCLCQQVGYARMPNRQGALCLRHALL